LWNINSVLKTLGIRYCIQVSKILQGFLQNRVKLISNHIVN